MKKSFLFTSIICCFAFITNVKAQRTDSDYKNAIGIKFYPGAITFKHFMNDKSALEFLGAFWNRGYRFTGLYEYHGDITGAPGLKWYVGGGAHIGGWRTRYWRDHYATDNSIGLDGVLGLDYKVNGAPIDFAIDWQPSVEFMGDYPWGYGWGGISIRYAF